VSPARTRPAEPALSRAYLDRQLARVRAIVRLRVLWLREGWGSDATEPHFGLAISDAQADRLLRGEDAEQRACFLEGDERARALREEIRVHEDECAVLLRRQREEGTTPHLALLEPLFGLDPFERDVLLLCLAADMDEGLLPLYAYLQDDVSRKYLTPNLALTLLAPLHGDRHRLRDAFQPNAPLRAFRLLTLEESARAGAPPACRPLRLDDRIADFLRGNNRLDTEIAALLRRIGEEPLSSRQQALVDSLVRPMREGADRAPWRAIQFVGPEDAGQQGIARAVCDALGIHLYALDTRRMPAGRETLALLEREAVLLQYALWVEHADVDALGALLEQMNVFLFVSSRERVPTTRPMLTIDLCKPDAVAQAELWREHLGPRARGIEAVVQQFSFGPAAIARAAAAAWQAARLRAPETGAPPTERDVWRACRAQTSVRLERLAHRLEPGFGWEDIVLPEDMEQQLRDITAQVAGRDTVYERWGFGARLSRGRGINVLFAGPSGTGKTMAAEVLANELDLDLFRIDLSSVVSKYIGETEENLRQVFDAADETGVMLFFDEADALFGKRTEVKDSHDRFANIEIDYLLQRMEQYRGLAILATNRRSALDRAFLRRLRFVVDFPFPDLESRRRIWEIVFPPQMPRADLDLDALARLQVTGGNIRNIALNAAFLAAAAGVPVAMEHLHVAARREYAKIEKRVSDTEFAGFAE